MKTRILACFLCLAMLLTLAGAPAYATAESAENDTAREVQSLLDGIVAFQLEAAGASSVQAWLDGALAQEAGISAEWYVLALSQSGGYDFSAYQTELRKYLADTTVRSAATRQKYALALMAVGCTDAYIAAVMEDSIGQQGVMSWVYGLHLLNNGCECSAATVASAREQLLSMQLEDGGWAVSGTVSDPDVTAMALQALAPGYHTDPAVTASVNRALELLSQRQLEGGDYASYGVPCPESTAQVLTALSALGIDALRDERFIKDGKTLLDGLGRYLLPDGSLSHTLGGASNSTATAQTFHALTAYQRFASGKPGIYLIDRKPSAGETPVFTESVSPGYKPVAAAAILGGAAVICLALFLMKKRSRKNFLAVAAAAALLIGFVFITDFQTADSYYSGQPSVKANPVGTVTLTIRCDTVAGRSDAAYIPGNGVILEPTPFAIAQGDTVYDILTEAARVHGIHVESSGAQGMAYIAGVNYLYEFAFGDLSGWIYFVNGQSPSVGCDQYALSDGDVIEWLYSTDLGNDLK